MGKMLHNEARELLVESYEKTHNAEEIAKIFGVNKYTVYHMAERKRKTGSVALRTSQRGRKQLLNDEDKQHIRQCIDETPDITLAELCAKLGLKASIQTLSRVVRAMGYRVKKKSMSASEQERPDVRKERTDWRGSGLEKQADHLVFLDESSVNIDLTRRYGRSIGKTRVHGHAPLSTPRAQTVLGSVRLNGQTTHTTYTGGTTGQRFLEYLKDILIPTLHKGDIVVMDNMRSHHVKEVAETLHAAGIELRYLPPYSPDMNPIEMLWSKVKALLRKWKCRTAELLPKTVSCALLCASQRDCVGWFKVDGYCL